MILSLDSVFKFVICQTGKNVALALHISRLRDRVFKRDIWYFRKKIARYLIL